jgi:hypothetical protein
LVLHIHEVVHLWLFLLTLSEQDCHHYEISHKWMGCHPDPCNNNERISLPWKPANTEVLAEQFWSRWRREYLQTLQSRRKWHYLTLELLATTKMTNRWIHYMNLNTVLRKWSIPVIGVYFSYLFYNSKRISLHWKRANTEDLAEQIWSRWRREYLQTLQSRRKWQQTQENIQEGDLVILITESLTTDHSE